MPIPRVHSNAVGNGGQLGSRCLCAYAWGSDQGASSRVSSSCFVCEGGELFNRLFGPRLGLCSIHQHLQARTPTPPMAPPPQQPPAPARTLFTYVAGATAANRAPSFDCVDDSPLVTSLTFLPWVLGAAGTPARIPRSSLVGTILKATRRPSDADLIALRGRPLFTVELLSASASAIAHILDCAGAFDSVYRVVEEWEAAIPGFLASMTAAAIATLRLRTRKASESQSLRVHAPAPSAGVRSVLAYRDGWWRARTLA